MSDYKDNVWLLGEGPGLHHANAAYHLPGVNRMTPMEGLQFFGIRNLCRMKMGADSGKSFLDDPLLVGDMARCCLTLVGSAMWKPAGNKRDDMDEILTLARQDKRYCAAIIDDFNTGTRPQTFTPAVLRECREELHTALDRPLDFWSVIYERDIGQGMESRAREFDLTTFWTWYAENLKDLSRNLEFARSLTSDGRVILGLYMYDYGNGKPLSDDAMRRQLDFSYEKFQSKEIEGVMLCSNCIADIGLSAVELTRDWLAQV